jgi:signal transduction histidine kinase
MKPLSFSSLRVRLLLLFALAVIPALAWIFYVHVEQRRLAATEAQDNAIRLAQLAAAQQAQLIQGAHQLLSVLAQLPAVRTEDAAACTTLFTELLKRHPVYANLGADRLNGDVFCSATPLSHSLNVANHTWFQRAIQGQKFTIGEYQKSRISNEFILVLGYPVFDDGGHVQGVVAASLHLDRLHQIATQAQFPPGATLTAIDRNGIIVARSPDPQHWLGLSLPQAPLIKAMLTQEEGTTQLPGVDGVQRLYAFSRVRDASDVGLYVSVGIPTAIAFAPAHQRLVRNLFTLGAITLLIITAVWIGSNAFVLRPVNALLQATERLRAGDLSARTDLPHGDTELEQLAAAFDEMAWALRRRETEHQRAEETLQVLSRRLLEAQESERRAIARELHDELGQALQALKINLQTVQRFPKENAQRVEESIAIVDHTLQQVRNLSVDLRPSLLDDLGLVAALEWYVDRQAQRVGFVGHCLADPPDLRVDLTVETVCFRVVQEALTNIARHAHATEVWVDLRRREQVLFLLIRDDGIGFDVPAARERVIHGTSFGLLGMQERVELAGGHFEIRSTAGHGTEIHVRFPLPQLSADTLQPSAPAAPIPLGMLPRHAQVNRTS